MTIFAKKKKLAEVNNKENLKTTEWSRKCSNIFFFIIIFNKVTNFNYWKSDRH